MKLERINDQIDEIRGKVKEQWSKLTNSDLDNFSGDLDGLTTILAKRYQMTSKQAKEEVGAFADGLSTSLKDAVQAIGDSARDLLRSGRDHVSKAVNATTEKASDLWSSSKEHVQHWGEEANKQIKARPMTALAIAAGVGALIGFLWMRRK